MTSAKMTEPQVNTALAVLAKWSGQPFDDETRAAWRLMLRSFSATEFADCAAQWSKTAWGNKRPTIGDLSKFRETKSKPRDVEREREQLRDQTAWLDEPIDRDEHAAGVALCRHALSEARARHPSGQEDKS
jgi:hypothetical protein